jgi:hypothetical protein
MTAQPVTAIPVSEYDFHRTVAAYLSRALPGDTLWFHPANGGYRRASEAGRLKSMGVLPGMPDIGVVNIGRIVWLELKSRKGRLSSAQSYCHERLRNAGSQVYVCKTLEDVATALDAAGIPKKPRIRLL